MTTIPAAPRRKTFETGNAAVRACAWPKSDCDRKAHARHLCASHYARARQLGMLDQFANMPHAQKRPVDRWLNAYGYVMVRPEDDSAALPEHRVVMERMLGRQLVKGETVHHINGIRHDNREENLELWFAQPYGQRVDDLLAYVIEHHRAEIMEKLA